jgi:hypothetical protein
MPVLFNINSNQAKEEGQSNQAKEEGQALRGAGVQEERYRLDGSVLETRWRQVVR